MVCGSGVKSCSIACRRCCSLQRGFCSRCTVARCNLSISQEPRPHHAFCNAMSGWRLVWLWCGVGMLCGLPLVVGIQRKCSFAPARTHSYGCYILLTPCRHLMFLPAFQGTFKLTPWQFPTCCSSLQGDMVGRIQLVRCMYSSVDSMRVTSKVFAFSTNPGSIRVTISGSGPPLLRSNISISNNNIFCGSRVMG